MVGIIMGSESDLKIMSQASQILQELEVEFELTVVSAHRTPDRMLEYAQTAGKRGIKVIIAGAGGAAAGPGRAGGLTDSASAASARAKRPKISAWNGSRAYQ